MEIRPLAVPGAWEITPKQFADSRGAFMEWFKAETFATMTGHPFTLAQANCSVSAAGVIRGIHFADVPPGQAKYVTCASGAVLDVAVDIRPDSPTFGQWDSVLLDDVDHRVIYLEEGVGHAFMALEDSSTVLYLCSTGYNPTGERGVNPLCATIGIQWPTHGRDGRPVEHILSDKDAAAPGLLKARDLGILPTSSAVTEYLEGLRA